jgi:hypothetical protein
LVVRLPRSTAIICARFFRPLLPKNGSDKAMYIFLLLFFRPKQTQWTLASKQLLRQSAVKTRGGEKMTPLSEDQPFLS